MWGILHESLATELSRSDGIPVEKISDGKSQCSEGQSPTRRWFQSKFHADERALLPSGCLESRGGSVSAVTNWQRWHSAPRLDSVRLASPVEWATTPGSCLAVTSQPRASHGPATEFLGTVTWNNGGRTVGVKIVLPFARPCIYLHAVFGVAH